MHLSKLGIETTAEYFANGFKKSNATDFSSLTKLPSQFQATTLSSIGSSFIEQQLDLLQSYGGDLSPAALEILAKNLKNNVEDNKIIDILWDIYHYDTSTFFLRSAIINIMGSFTDTELVIDNLKSIAKDQTNSKIVASRAQSILDRCQSF